MLGLRLMRMVCRLLWVEREKLLVGVHLGAVVHVVVRSFGVHDFEDIYRYIYIFNIRQCDCIARS
jgi:hypothetical protein